MSAQRTIAIVTGTRAEFGLLTPIMRAIDAHDALDLQVIVTGTHLLPAARTIEEVRKAFPIAAEIPMQDVIRTGRNADAAALGRGITGFAAHFQDNPPDIVLVLGDRIEAFAAAAAASVAGIRIAHVHGGDRAEGIADESLRHAISKLSHIHFPATRKSAERLQRMGEPESQIIEVGSPAIDDLDAIPRLDDARYEELGCPEIIVLHHPCGRDDAIERAEMEMILNVAHEAGRVLALHPNHDPGRDGILEAIERMLAPERISDRGSSASTCPRASVTSSRSAPHLPREQFIGLLRRARCLLGNSSAGLIECAALGLPAVNIGRRQHGRERAANLIDVPFSEPHALRDAINVALSRAALPSEHPFGEGRAGERIAASLASVDLEQVPIRKLNTY